MDHDGDNTRAQRRGIGEPARATCADAELQTFIDRVVIPALLERLLHTQAAVGSSTRRVELPKPGATV